MKSLIKLFCIVFACGLLSSCETETDITPFKLELTSIRSVASTGEITFRAESNYIGSIVEKGFCVSTSSVPSLSDKVYVVAKSDLSEYDYYNCESNYYRGYTVYSFDYVDEWGNIYHASHGYNDVVEYKTTVNNLESGVKYYVCAYAISKKNNVVYSNVKEFVIK